MDQEEISHGELNRNIAALRGELKADIVELKGSLADVKSNIIYKDTYVSDQSAVQTQLRLHMELMEEQNKTTRTLAEHADKKSDVAIQWGKWAVGLLVSILGVLVTILIFVIQQGGNTP